MSTNPYRHEPQTGDHMGVDEYFALDDLGLENKYEYDDGVIRMMSGGSVAHDEITANVRHALKVQLATGPCTSLGPNLRTQVTPSRKYYYPDVVVSCDVDDRRRTNKLIRSPRIVVEVLSPGTEAEDRGKKLKAYQSCETIQEYVLVSQFAMHVEVYRRHENGSWSTQPQVYSAGDTIALLSIDVAIPIAEFYDGVNFEEFMEDDI